MWKLKPGSCPGFSFRAVESDSARGSSREPENRSSVYTGKNSASASI